MGARIGSRKLHEHLIKASEYSREAECDLQRLFCFDDPRVPEISDMVETYQSFLQKAQGELIDKSSIQHIENNVVSSDILNLQFTSGLRHDRLHQSLSDG